MAVSQVETENLACSTRMLVMREESDGSGRYAIVSRP